MGEDISEEQKGNNERRLSQDQYEMLKRCSDKKDMADEAGDIVHNGRAGRRVFTAGKEPPK